MAFEISTAYSKMLTSTGIIDLGGLDGTMPFADNYSGTSPLYTQEEMASHYPELTYRLIGFSIGPYIEQAKSAPGTYIKLFTLSNQMSLALFFISGIGMYMQVLDPNDNVITGASKALPLYGTYNNSTATGKTLCLFFVKNRTLDIIGFGLTFAEYANVTRYAIAYTFTTTSPDMMDTLFNGAIVDLGDPYILDENQTPPGGYGPFNYSGDDDLPPALPTLSAAQVGFVSLWNPSAAEMKALANYLWTGTFDLTNFRKLFTDPMECILSVGIVPVTPTTGPATEIVFGGSSHSGVNAKPITDQFVTMDFGRLHVNGQSASALDYSPYAKASLFLPYCGTYSLDIDDIMDADIDLEYHIDIYTGACVAYVTITRTNSDGSTLHSTLYQFTGNVLATIPVTGADHSAFLQSLLFMGASVAATVATAGAGAPAIEGAAAAGDVGGAAALNAVTASSAVNTVMSMKPNVLRSGNLSSTAGLLGKQKPCLTITWSNLCRPEDENVLLGMPLHKSGTLSDFEGFTIVSAVHMDDILCTDAERRMIEQLLYKGVII